MTRADLLEVMRGSRWAVQASVSPGCAPQAAVIGVVVTDDLEVFFDTLDTTRKLRNLRADPRIALVIGWDDGRTAQLEGIADEPAGDELARLKALYLARFPDGRARERLPGISYVRVRPTWIRCSDFRTDPPDIVELDADAWRAR